MLDVDQALGEILYVTSLTELLLANGHQADVLKPNVDTMCFYNHHFQAVKSLDTLLKVWPLTYSSKIDSNTLSGLWVPRVLDHRVYVGWPSVIQLEM